MRLSFSLLTNYLQCPFRVALLQTKPDTLLFEPQYTGLYAHEWVERYLRMKINCEAVSLKRNDIHKAIMREDRIVVGNPQPPEEKLMKEWAEQILDTILTGVNKIHTELRLEKQYGEHIVTGIADVLAIKPEGNFVIDLKRSNFVKHYDAKQTTLYSWLLSDYKVTTSHLVFLKDNGSIEDVAFQLSQNQNLLNWMLNTLDKIGNILENELWEYLPPNIGNRTCHPNRCSVFYMCPYGNETIRELESRDTINEDFHGIIETDEGDTTDDTEYL